MRQKRKLHLAFLLIFMLGTVSPAFIWSYASENFEIEFEVIGIGDMSGYCEEAYLVVRTETEWEAIWEKHTLSELSATPHPRIDFTGSIVVCAFMGRRPTAGYSISIQRIWTDGKQVHVEIAKSSPPEDFAVAQVITCLFTFAMLEKTDLHFIFQATEENWSTNEYVLPEFSTITHVLLTLVILSAAIVKMKFSKRLNAENTIKTNISQQA